MQPENSDDPVATSTVPPHAEVLEQIKTTGQEAVSKIDELRNLLDQLDSEKSAPESLIRSLNQGDILQILNQFATQDLDAEVEQRRVKKVPWRKVIELVEAVGRAIDEIIEEIKRDD